MMTTKAETNANAVRLYNLIFTYQEEHGCLPTIREIVVLAGASSTSVISYYLRLLASWHWIDWTPGAARTLHLTRPTENICYLQTNPEVKEEDMSEKTCVVEDCDRPRWAGPHGDKYLTMCEQHQKEYWRKKKAGRPAETERTCTDCGQTFPLTEEHFPVRENQGTFRKQCKGCYDKRLVNDARYQMKRAKRQPPTPAVPVQPIIQEAEAKGETVKVVVVDRAHDEVFRIEVPKRDQLGKPLSKARNAERLIAFYRRSGHIVVEV